VSRLAVLVSIVQFRFGESPYRSPSNVGRTQRTVSLAGKIRIPIAASYPLGKAAQAHRRLDRGHVLGRMVLQTRRLPTK
jgi:hypothetical protein